MVELSPRAEIWCAYIASINDGTQTLTFQGIHNNRDFQDSRFFCGDSIILNSGVDIYFQIDCNCCISRVPVLGQRSKRTNYPQKTKNSKIQKLIENSKSQKSKIHKNIKITENFFY